MTTWGPAEGIKIAAADARSLLYDLIDVLGIDAEPVRQSRRPEPRRRSVGRNGNEESLCRPDCSAYSYGAGTCGNGRSLQHIHLRQAALPLRMNCEPGQYFITESSCEDEAIEINNRAGARSPLHMEADL